MDAESFVPPLQSGRFLAGRCGTDHRGVNERKLKGQDSESAAPNPTDRRWAVRTSSGDSFLETLQAVAKVVPHRVRGLVRIAFDDRRRDDAVLLPGGSYGGV